MAKMFGLSEKVGEFTIVEAIGIAAAKSISERLLTPLVGNGTLMSAAVKGVGGAAISGMTSGKISNMVATAMIVDAGEDLINFIMPANALSSLTTAPSNQNSRRVL